MSECQTISSEITTILNEVATTLNLTKYSINFDKKALQAEGFLGEFFLAQITDQTSNTTLNLALKKSFKNELRRQISNISAAFYNENYFYSKILPQFLAFQKNKNLQSLFQPFSKYFYGSNEPLKEVIVLENLKLEGFGNLRRDQLLNKDLLQKIFATYGKFHALSFALRDQHPKDFKNLTGGIKDFWSLLCDCKQFEDSMGKMIKEAFACIEKTHPEAFDQCRKYHESPAKTFKKTLNYSGDNVVINHGDCWSNNMMFKFGEDGTLKDLRLIDFQLIHPACPIYDLSYFFYAGGSKEHFDCLEDYLKIYHESLSSFIRDLGSDPEKLYCFEQFKKDWIEYAKFGMIFSLLVVKVKLMKQEDMERITNDDTAEEALKETDGFSMGVDYGLYEERVRDILLHGYNLGIL